MNDDKEANGGAIAALVIGLIALICLIGLLVWWHWFRRNKENKVVTQGRTAGVSTLVANGHNTSEMPMQPSAKPDLV